jgi:tetrahydromethanopterin S-methyltransferase subunit G
VSKLQILEGLKSINKSLVEVDEQHNTINKRFDAVEKRLDEI